MFKKKNKTDNHYFKIVSNPNLSLSLSQQTIWGVRTGDFKFYSAKADLYLQINSIFFFNFKL